MEAFPLIDKISQDKLFDKVAAKSNNRLKATQTIDQILKIPNFVRKNSFEGVALKAATSSIKQS